MKLVGWRYESYRHSLARRGVKTSYFLASKRSLRADEMAGIRLLKSKSINENVEKLKKWNSEEREKYKQKIGLDVKYGDVAVRDEEGVLKVLPKLDVWLRDKAREMHHSDADVMEIFGGIEERDMTPEQIGEEMAQKRESELREKINLLTEKRRRLKENAWNEGIQ